MSGEVRGRPVTINGRTGGTPGPATGTSMRVKIPTPVGYPTAITTFARAVYLNNVDAANDLYLFFDSGVDRVTIPAGGGYQIPGSAISSFIVMSSAASTQWEAVAVVAA